MSYALRYRLGTKYADYPTIATFPTREVAEAVRLRMSTPGDVEIVETD